MNRLARLIQELPLDELHLLRKDVASGTLLRLIDERVLGLQVTKSCPTCGRELTVPEQRYSLEFGPTGLRQKAWFDELDCLDYFMKHHIKEPRGNTQ